MWPLPPEEWEEDESEKDKERGFHRNILGYELII
jgi:hypothetical protein